MLLSERELGLSDEHEGIVDLPADAPVGSRLCRLGRARRSGHRRRRDAQPPRCARHLRHRPRPRRQGRRPAEADRCRSVVAGAFESPIGVELRFDDPDERALPALRRPLFPRREERPVARPGCSGGSAPSGSGRSPRWSTSPTTSPTTYARPLHVFDADKVKGTIHARLARDGETIEALDGKTYTLDSVDDGDRRRQRRRSASAASSAAMATGCTSGDDERLPRGRLVRSDPHRRDRPQARHQFRCALPLRARRRPGLRRARRGDRDAHDPRALRRRGLRARHRRAARRSAASPFRFASTG